MNLIDQAVKATQQQAPQPPVVQPHPAPMSVQLTTSQDPQGNKYLILIIHHATGQSVFHFHPDNADQLADAIKDAARVARTGLEIPRVGGL